MAEVLTLRILTASLMGTSCAPNGMLGSTVSLMTPPRRAFHSRNRSEAASSGTPVRVIATPMGVKEIRGMDPALSTSPDV